MGTTLALVAVALIALGGWSIYVATGARRWTTERDPLGEPPIRMAALIAAVVIGVGLVSTGGGGAERESAMQQGQGETDGLLGGAEGTAEAAAAPSGGQTTASNERRTPAGSATPTSQRPTPRSTSEASTGKASSGRDLPSYGKLVVRARKAARRRGAEIRWYPTLAAEAREATDRRSR